MPSGLWLFAVRVRHPHLRQPRHRFLETEWVQGDWRTLLARRVAVRARLGPSSRLCSLWHDGSIVDLQAQDALQSVRWFMPKIC
jgi:hypothetical protein